MVGIESCGVYLPYWRLDLRSIFGDPRERTIASFDEDSLTMGVAAGRNCLKDIKSESIDGLYFASTTFPYSEKLNAAIVAEVLDLRNNILTADFSNSLRAGTIALKAAFDAVKAGSAKRILVICSDVRMAQPGSDLEKDFGDGAAAFLISNDAKVSFLDSYSISNEIFDFWRVDGDRFVRSWEERFIVEEGYLSVLMEAVKGLLTKLTLAPKDIAKAAFNGPTGRRHQQMGQQLGFKPEQVEPSMFGTIGDTGTSFSLVLLASCLSKAKAGDKILLANYGNGADTFLLQMEGKLALSPSLQDYVTSKIILKDYKRFLHWRGIVEMSTGRRRPPVYAPSATCLNREREQNLRLYGVKCKKCGMVQYPPQRVCFNCHTKDEFERYRFADKIGELATYTEDYSSPTPDPPLVISVIDFKGGGRMWAYMTDGGEKKPFLNMPVELTFRKLYYFEGFHNYFWKCMPMRFGAKED